MTPIRILHVVEAFGVGGGVETGIHNLIKHMDPVRFQHILCGVFRLGPLIEKYPSERVQIFCLEQSERRFSTQVRPLARAIRRLQPDIVHSRNWGALEAVPAARWVRSCAVIHSEHGVEANPSAEPLRRSYFRRITFAFADKVFAVSHQLRKLLAERTGFSLSKMSVIHNGVDTTRFHPNDNARELARRELNVSADEFCIGCVGRLNRIKDYPTILRAVEPLSHSCQSWRLFIVGAGPELPALQEFIHSRPILATRVRFLGESNRVPEFLRAMDAYVLPSICEGISNSLLEAMATGLPVAVTDTGGNPEVISDGESGLLFPVGDCRALADQLAFLSNNPKHRNRLGQAAAQRVRESFSLSSMVRKYDEMYTDLVGLRPRVAHAQRKAFAR